MEKNEIKKKLYKQKPTAIFSKIQSGMAYYYTSIDKLTDQERTVVFEIPVSDMGNTPFEVSMSSQLLIRWVV